MCDGELVKSAQVGDREAFGELVLRYQGLVYGLCYGMTGNAPDAEDLAHEAFVEAYLKLHTLRDPEKFRPWVRTLALNLCRMWFRQLKREREGVDAFPDSQVEEDALYAVMSGGLNRLSESHRLALVLHYWEELSYQEMAAFLDVPVGTVMSRLHRARKALKQGMREMAEDEDIPMASGREFREDVDVEIDLLLEMSDRGYKPVERLSVIFSRSPERLADLVRRVEEEMAQHRLARLLRKLRRPAMEVVLECFFSSDAVLQTRAGRILMRWAAECKPGPLYDDHVFLDLVIESSVDTDSKVALLLDLMEAAKDGSTQTLFANLLLCDPDAAFPLLMERFWGAPGPEELYGDSGVLYALCRMGTRFCEALLEPLARGDAHRQVLALAGMEAVARAIERHRSRFEGDSKFEDAPEEQRMTEVRFRKKFAPLSSVHLNTSVLQAAIDRVGALVSHPRPEVRNRAIGVLGRMKAEAFVEPVRLCLTHDEVSTRLGALKALAEMGDARCAESLMAAARRDNPLERRMAVEALGRLRVSDARQLVVELIDDPDAQVRQTAVIALGEIGDEGARTVLKGLIGSKDRRLVKTAASALYGGKGRGIQPSELTRKRLEKVRGDARPTLHLGYGSHIAIVATIRALPEIRPYGERELTRLIARVWHDYSTMRRYLVMEGRNSLMNRRDGIYELTALGKAVWRVERFVRKNYLKSRGDV